LLTGRAPQAFATSGDEFDALARNAASAAEGAARAPLAERSNAMRAVELNSCTRCHMKYRDGVVEDISRWPEVKPWVR
jgi:cytochrome c553